jgi:transcriptional regulator with XRE-family HTH domain
LDSVSRQLGEFLSLKRRGLNPKDVGLPETGRRRTPGLRRGEVAELAGISTDWYMRLEQGRNSLPSKGTAEAIAKALKLRPSDRAHLLRLAQGDSGRAFAKESVPPSVEKLLKAMTNPAYIVGARWDLLAWNQAAAETFRDFSKIRPDERNMLYQMFVEPTLRARYPNWARDAREMVENFRASYDVWANSPEFTHLVEQIGSLSPEFRRWWKAHAIGVRNSGEKVIHGGTRGRFTLCFSTFLLADDPSLRLVVYARTDKR